MMWAGLGFLLCFLLGALLLADPASAWETESIAASTSPQYATGFVYYNNCVGCHFKSSPTPPGYSWIIRGTTTSYAYYSFDVSNLKPDARVESIDVTVAFYDPGGGASGINWSVRPLYVDPILWNAEPLYDVINQAPNWDTFVNGANDVRTFRAGFELHRYISEAISDGNDTVRIALGTNSPNNWDLFPRSNVTIAVRYDDEPPLTPGMRPPAPYINTTSLQSRWNLTTDNGTGVAGYQATWSTDPNLGVLGGLSPWLANTSTAYTFNWLPERVPLYFTVRARDGANFTSPWAPPSVSVVDLDPPTKPTLYVPRYSPTSVFQMTWDAATDPTSGVAWYRIDGVATNGRHLFGATFLADSRTQENVSVASNNANVDYWATITAIDGAGNPSPPSDRVYFMWDDSPPDNVSLELEPLYSPGLSNTVRWNDSLDLGVGGVVYEAQASVDLSFVPLAGATNTPATNATFTGLAHGQKYYYRVRALDAYGHATEWSVTYSTQDAEPPTDVVVTAPRWTNEWTIPIEWTPASDGLSGLQYYIATIYGPTAGPAGQSLTTFSTTAHLVVTGIVRDHRICVVAVDMVGLRGNESCALATVDTTPPTIRPDAVPIPIIIAPGETAEVHGNASDAQSGVASVEGSSDGTTWTRATGNTSWSWSPGWPPPEEACDEYAQTEGTFLLRVTDAAGNSATWDGWVSYVRQLCGYPFEVVSPSPGELVSGTVTVLVRAPHQDGMIQFGVFDDIEPDALYGSGEEPSPPSPGGLLAFRWNTTSLMARNYNIVVNLPSGESLEVPVYVANAGFSIVSIETNPAQPVANSTVEVRYVVAWTGQGWTPPYRIEAKFISPNSQAWVDCSGHFSAFEPGHGGGAHVADCEFEVGNWTSFEFSLRVIPLISGAPEAMLTREFVVVQPAPLPPDEPPAGTQAPVADAGDGSLGLVALAVALLALGLAVAGAALTLRRGRPAQSPSGEESPDAPNAPADEWLR